jgi:protein-disulfide isomerase
MTKPRRALLLFAVGFGVAAAGAFAALRSASVARARTPGNAVGSKVAQPTRAASAAAAAPGSRAVTPATAARQAHSVERVLAKPIDIEGAPQRGAKNAKVTVVIFGRHDSSTTLVYEKKLRRLERGAHARQLRVVWKDAPMRGRGFSQLAAEAVRAAGAQGQFWPMHDWVVGSHQTLSRALFESRAQELGLDLARFRSDLDSHRYRQIIDRDAAEAREQGIGPYGAVVADGRILDRGTFEQELKRMLSETRAN